MAAHKAEYQAIDSLGESLTLNERRVGAFALVSE